MLIFCRNIWYFFTNFITNQAILVFNGSLLVSQVLKECKKVLLQCATPEALVRLPHTKLMLEENHLMHEYFNEQKHGSLQEYLVHRLVDNHPTDTVFLQVCTTIYEPAHIKDSGRFSVVI